MELHSPIRFYHMGALKRYYFIPTWHTSLFNFHCVYWKKKKIALGCVCCVCVFFFKVDMPILTCIFFTFNWLTLTSEMHFVKFHPEVASCLLSRGERKYASLGMRLLWKYIRNYFLVYQLTSHFLSYLQNYKEFEAEILDLQLEKYGLSFKYQKMYYFQLSHGGWECDWHKVL